MRHSSHPSKSVNLFAARTTPAIYRTIAYSFVGVTVVVVIGTLWLSSARARVTISMKKELKNIDTVIEVAKTAEEGQLRGRVVNGTFEKIQEFAVKEGTAIEGTARGVVAIVNTYSKPQTLVEKTRLLTADNRLYRIEKTIVVQPKQLVQVTARADQAGAAYTLDPGTKLTIPGLWKDLQKWIYAKSVSGFTPTKTVKKITGETELNEAFNALQESVFEQAKKALKAEAGVGDEWDVVYEKKIVEKKSNASIGQPGESFLASLKLEVTAVFYPKNETRELLRKKLQEMLSTEREMVGFDPERATYTIEQVDTTSERARVRVAAQALSRLTEKNARIAKAQFLGLSEEEAKTKLLAIDGVQNVEIRIRPAWIRRIPSKASRVEFVVQ